MALRTVKLRRLLGATALCGGNGNCRDRHWRGRGKRGPVGPAAALASPGGMGTATAALYPIASLLMVRSAGR
jgi:hypothetical protein